MFTQKNYHDFARYNYACRGSRGERVQKASSSTTTEKPGGDETPGGDDNPDDPKPGEEPKFSDNTYTITLSDNVVKSYLAAETDGEEFDIIYPNRNSSHDTQPARLTKPLCNDVSRPCLPYRGRCQRS